MEPVSLLGIALALGLLIGAERGWQEREAPEGRRFAGIRTFGLFGLLGGLWALLGQSLGPMLPGLAFIALAAVLVLAHLEDVRANRDVGITTVVAALVTFALGAIAVIGEPAAAAAGAVVTVTLLSLKPVLHGWLRRIEDRDLYAGIKLLLISVVILPALPNEGYGPWGALNPFEIWFLVVLVASISFAGYLAIKLTGTQRGMILTGLLGGMVSSTATTVNLSRIARGEGAVALASIAIVLASAMMFVRMLVFVAVLAPALVLGLLLPAGLMVVVLGAAAAWLGYRGIDGEDAPDLQLANPTELRTAVGYGILLAAVMLLATGLDEWLGSRGIYIAAAISGIADVDAITVSLARMSSGAADATPMQQGILLAAIVNTLFKGVLTTAIAGRGAGMRVMTAMIVASATGAAAVWLI